MMFKTADLHDRFGDRLQVAQHLLRDFGGRDAFHGPISTVLVYEENVLVREALESSGEGRVLVIDGGGSLRCALVGDQLAQIAINNGWQGIVIYGCIRDAAEIARMPIGVRALASIPRRSAKRGHGERDVPVRFADTRFAPGAWLYADLDGIVISAERCHQETGHDD